MRAIIDAFRQLKTISFHPVPPNLLDYSHSAVMNASHDHVMHCWKIPHDVNWHYCLLISEVGRGQYWSHGDFEPDLFPYMHTLLGTIKAQLGVSLTTSSQDDRDTLKQRWLEQHGEMIGSALFLYIMSQLSWNIDQSELNSTPETILQEEGIESQVAALQCGLLIEFAVRWQAGFPDSADDAFHALVEMVHHISCRLHRVLEQQRVAALINKLPAVMVALLQTSPYRHDEESRDAAASLLTQQSQVFYSLGHCNKMRASLAAFPEASTGLVNRPFLPEWREMLVMEAEAVVMRTSNQLNR